MSSDKIKVSWDDIQTLVQPQKTVIPLDSCRESEPFFKGEEKIPKSSLDKPSFFKKLLSISVVIIGIFILGILFVWVSGISFESAFQQDKNKQQSMQDNSAVIAANIESVLQQDKNIPQGIQANSAVEAVCIAVNKMRSIDLSECPEDFRYAYQKHTEAWAKAIPIIRQAEELNGFGNVLKSFVVGLIGGYTGQFQLIAGNIMENEYASKELEKAFEQVDSEIKTTYYQVLRIAQKYKVNTTPYVCVTIFL